MGSEFQFFSLDRFGAFEYKAGSIFGLFTETEFVARPIRLQFEGGLYHLIVRANNRQHLFRDDRDRRRYLELLSRYRARFGFRIYAYLLMSRHVDLLVETPRANLSKLMQCLGTSYSSYFNRRYKRRGAVFEGRYKSYLIDKENYLPEITRYIHRTHLREGLRNRTRDYPWSSYRVYLGRMASNLIETEAVLKKFGRGTSEQRKRYQKFVETGNFRDNAYPSRVNFQQVVGSPSFIEKVCSQPLSSADSQSFSLAKAQEILHEVHLSISPDWVRGLVGTKYRALSKHVAMYLIRKQTNLPLRSIGEIFGVKAPAVALALGKVERLLRRPDFSSKLRGFLNRDFPLPSDPAREFSPVQQEGAHESSTA